MKLIFVSSDGDYAANSFENEFGGTKVSDIIKNPDDFQHSEFEVEVLEIGEVDKRFIEFVRNNIQDYDNSKDKNFWMDGEVVGE